MQEPDPQPAAARYLPAITLAALVVVLLAGWWLFPRVQAYMAEQDCIASGRTNCVQLPAESKP